LVGLRDLQGADGQQADVGKTGDDRRLVAGGVEGDQRVIGHAAIGSRIHRKGGGSRDVGDDGSEWRPIRQAQGRRDGIVAAVEGIARHIGIICRRSPGGLDALRNHLQRQIRRGTGQNTFGQCGGGRSAPTADALLSVVGTHACDFVGVETVAGGGIDITCGGAAGNRGEILISGLARALHLEHISRGVGNGIPSQLDGARGLRRGSQAARNRQRRQVALVNLENMRRDDRIADVAERVAHGVSEGEIFRHRASVGRQGERDDPGERIAVAGVGHGHRQNEAGMAGQRGGADRRGAGLGRRIQRELPGNGDGRGGRHRNIIDGIKHRQRLVIAR